MTQRSQRHIKVQFPIYQIAVFFFLFNLIFFLSLLKMKFIVAAIAAFAVSMVSAQSAVATPHSPTLNQVLTAGQTTTIAWTPVTGVDTISSIDLLSGSATALQPVAGGHVASNVQASLGTYSWTVPADLPTGTDCKL